LPLFDIVGYTTLTESFLSISYYFDAYRENPDFKRALVKAKKNYEANLLKYGKNEISE